MDDEVLTDEEKKMDTKNPIPTWVALISIISAVAFGSWTISAEVHNTRFQSVVTRTDNHEFAIIDLRETDNKRAVAMEHLSTEMNSFGKTLEEVRNDVKTLLSTPK